ncbi:hypothetical protein QQE94_07295 [Fervidobacterium pennivorans subsp. shakshaketiis]|uniref:hypothetical protein n=1 Tax=Fervidobacterium pennivorans TaxID=93466 RepID=UPI00355B188D
MLEIILKWDLKSPTLVTEELIQQISQLLESVPHSVSHVLGKRIYASEYGYYIVKDATLKVRLATNSVGSALKRLLKTSLGGAFPYYSSVKVFQPFSECYVLANENFGEQPIESIQRAIEEYYFALAQHIYQGKNINYALIPVVKPYKRSIYKVELFGSEEMIALANVVGLRVGHFGLFLYDSTDLNLITKLSQKIGGSKLESVH